MAISNILWREGTRIGGLTLYYDILRRKNCDLQLFHPFFYNQATGSMYDTFYIQIHR